MPMQPVSGQLLNDIDAYIEGLFVPADPDLERTLKETDDAGLPAIAISPSQGKLMYLLAKMCGARRILEIGTLGGYSTTILARALPEGGKLISLELEPTNARVARRNVDRSGVGGLVEIRVGPAAETLAKMIAAKEEPFDLVFIDADKPGYVGYLNQTLELSHSGTVILGDNLVRHGAVLADKPTDAMAIGTKNYNAAIAAHPRLESILLPILKDKIDGMSISRVK